MKKIIISKLFLYRYRFQIGYILLGMAFLSLLFSLPLIAQTGLSTSEMESSISSFNLEPDAIINGDLVDLPYRLLQKTSILLFGLSTYSIKLPSIIIGVLFAIILILLLNRWFKNNVSLITSIIITLSTPFLFLAGNGTPLIMIVFWPTLLLWLGSKIQGEKRPNPIFCFAFAAALLLAIFTPYMIYFAIFCVMFVFFQPHLRFIVRNLPKIPLIIAIIVIGLGITSLIVNTINHTSVLKELFLAPDFHFANFFNNIQNGFSVVFSWANSLESQFLSPLISLPIFALALIGLFSTTKGFFASRNSIASILIIFTLIITGFNSNSIIFIVLPLSILVAHGIKYTLEKWYNLFPENPYARIFALLPLSILAGFIIIPSLLQYIYGYRYNPNVANMFSSNLTIVKNNLSDETLLFESDSLEYHFYHILEYSSNIKVINDVPDEISGNIASFNKLEKISKNHHLERIITSEKSNNSDIIYLYKEGE